MAEMLMWRALNEALRSILADDPKAFIMGEDLTRWAAGGGIYGVTRGLLKEFGQTRILDTPISEEAIVATAVGAALRGQHPIVEIMYSDFSLLAMDPIVNQAAKVRYMFGGQFDVPLVIRTNGGAGMGKAGQHSQSLETLFAHIPGLEVVVPAFPDDARALLISANSSPNPTIFLEHKALYQLRGDVGKASVPLGQARVVAPGSDVTVIATQLMVHRALEARERLQASGLSLEVVDLRTLFPLDLNTVYSSVRKTRRAMVCHEAPELFGFGGELAASVAQACWEQLDAPVGRLGGRRTPIPYAVNLEAEVIPSTQSISELAISLSGRPTAARVSR
jgi:acetoin:2,6-dichlorophenolindophenol oxidoreductase subunit beta